MNQENFDHFRSLNQRRLAGLEEDEVLLDEQSFKNQIVLFLLCIEQNRLILKDTQARLEYLRSIKPEAIIARANHGDLASE